MTFSFHKKVSFVCACVRACVRACVCVVLFRLFFGGWGCLFTRKEYIQL